MGTRRQPLNSTQVNVLEWVAHGCPDGEWTDFSYKTSVYALANRGLVTVDRRRGSWSADITDDGRYFLDHGHYRIDDEPQNKRPSDLHGRSINPTSFSINSEALLAELHAHDGALTVTDPPSEVRAAYRRAINKAIADHLLPDGTALRHTGRDRGDLAIRLVPLDESPDRPELAPVSVPNDLIGIHGAVRELRDSQSERLDVSPGVKHRALLILQAIADECGRRGHEFDVPPDGDETFRITVNGVPNDFVMLEELERQPIPNADELAGAKYDWQRVRSTVQKVPSGRLVIETGPRYARASWADRRRWTLDSRLPHLFAHAETAAAETLERRAREARERAERQRAWEQAKVEARRRYIEDLNRRRLGEQVESSRRAEEIRQYADVVEDRASGLDDEAEAQRHRAWAKWSRSEADRIDPVLDPAAMRYVDPDEVTDADLDPFMPRGMAARRPPDDDRPSWRR